jgi:hypothetical protein
LSASAARPPLGTVDRHAPPVALGDLSVREIREIDEALRAWSRKLEGIPFGILALDWCGVLERSGIDGLEIHILVVERGTDILAVGILYVVRRLDVPAYLPKPAGLPFRWLRRIGLRPIDLDVAYLEIPLHNRDGMLIPPGTAAEDAVLARKAVHEYVIDRISHDVLCCKTAAEPALGDFYRGQGLIRLPFIDNHLMDFPFDSFEAWLQSLHGSRRQTIRRKRRAFERAGGELSIERNLEAWADEFHRLYRLTVERHDAAGHLLMPFEPTRAYFHALASLPAGHRALIVARVNGIPASMLLLCHDGHTLFFLTAGVDTSLSRPSEAYLVSYQALLEFAAAHGLRKVDLGPTTPGPKLRVGAAGVPTEYWVRFTRWYLRPLGALIAMRFTSENDTNPTANET